VDLAIADWIATVEGEYLRDYLPFGGSVVKFAVVQSGEMARVVRSDLARVALLHDCQFVEVDAAATRIHMIDQLFFAVSRQIEWETLIDAFLRRLLARNGIIIPPDAADFTYRAIAAFNDDEELLLRQTVRRLLRDNIFRDYAMTKDFRLAMMRLALAALEPHGEVEPEVQAVRQWLTGELRLISALKPSLIFQKIARYNARDMFVSLAHWLRLCAKQGLVLTLDVSRYVQDRRPNDGSFFHSPMGAMDAWEVLRQFIDSTDDLEGVFIAVLAPPQFLEDPRRGLHRYDPLKMRVWDEVHDRQRVNPLAALVRLADCPPTLAVGADR
jgi:BREX system ATP-binding protein BrxC/D